MRILDFSDGFESSVAPDSVPVDATQVSVTPDGNLSSTDAQAAFEELQGDIDAINTSKGANNGIATLDSGGKVPSSQLPAIAITEVYVVADITARDALTVDEGDIAKVTDAGGGTTKTYIYDGSSWIEIQADGQLATHEADTSTHGVSTIAGLTETQVFTNKDYDGGTASNTSRLTLPKNTLTNLQALSRKEGTLVYSTDQQKAYVDNGSSLIPVGSGSGGGSLNYIENPDAETDTTGWATYADAAGTQPVDGTGGTANITWTRSTSSPLRGTASFLFTKDAANRQGQGASCDFTIDDADKAKVMQIGFDYAVASGTYATGDVAIYIVDVTNGTVIQPSAYQVENVGVNSTARLTFQTASNSTSYRLCFHVASTSASAYSLKFDNITLGPQVVPMGSVVTGQDKYTPTLNATTNVSARNGSWYRVGEFMMLTGSAEWNGTGAASVFTVALPSGYTIDLSKLNATGSYTDIRNGVGFWGWYDSAGGQAIDDQWARAYTATSISFIRGSNNVTSDMFANGDRVFWQVQLPIVGWSSSTVVSSSANTRVVAMRAYRATNQTGIGPNNSFVKLTYDTADFDTAGCFDSANSRFTVRVPGQYRIAATAYIASTNTLNNVYGLVIYKNGSLASYGEVSTNALAVTGFSRSATTDLRLVAGDYIEIYFFGQGNNSASTLTMTGGIAISSFSVDLIQGPSQIAMSEIIACRYTSDAAQSIANTGFQIVNFEDKTYDTHNAVTTGAGWKFTAPAPGKYEVSVTINYSAQTYAVGNNADVAIYKNGSVYSFGPTWDAQAAVSVQASNSYTDGIELNAGEYIDVRVANGRTAGATALAIGGVQVSIKRLGGM